MLSLVFYDGKYQKTVKCSDSDTLRFFLFVATFHFLFLSFLTKNEGSVPSGDEDVIHRLVACYLCSDGARSLLAIYGSRSIYHSCFDFYCLMGLGLYTAIYVLISTAIHT